MASNNGSAVTIAQVAEILKKVILPRIQKLIFTKTILLDKIPRDNAGVTFSNDKIYITGDTSGHSGTAFTGATGGIRIGKSKQSQMVSSAKYGYGGHIIWDSTLEITKNTAGSLVEYSKKLGMDLELAMRRSLNRQLYGNGQGVLTTVTSGASSTATHTLATTRFLQEGGLYLVGTKSEIEAGTADAVTVQSINSTTSVTFTSSITTATSDRVVIQGIWDGSAYQEIDGLDSLISNNTENAGSTVQGIARATNVWANSYVDSSSAQLLESHLVDAITSAYEFGNPQFIVTTPTLKNRYGAILQGIRRIVDKVDLGGGYSGLEVSAGAQPVGLISDFDCPAGNLFVIDPDAWSLAQLAPLGFLQSANGGVMEAVYDADGNRLPAYQTALKFYGNLVNLNLRANAKITNKTA